MTGHSWHYVEAEGPWVAGDWVRHTREPGARFKVHAVALNAWGEVKWVKVYGGPKGNEQFRYLKPEVLRKTNPPATKVA
jgi:hypothetical protein